MFLLGANTLNFTPCTICFLTLNMFPYSVRLLLDLCPHQIHVLF